MFWSSFVLGALETCSRTETSTGHSLCVCSVALARMRLVISAGRPLWRHRQTVSSEGASLTAGATSPGPSPSCTDTAESAA